MAAVKRDSAHAAWLAVADPPLLPSGLNRQSLGRGAQGRGNTGAYRRLSMPVWHHFRNPIRALATPGGRRHARHEPRPAAVPRVVDIVFQARLKPPTRPPRESRAWAAMCACLGLSAPAAADVTTTALARFSSNYLYHGYTKSDDHPVAQVHAGITHGSGVYGGAWMTAVDFGGAQFELVPYVGIQRGLPGGLRIDAVVSGYVYEAEVFGEAADYVETSLSLDWRGLVTARGSVAFDSYGSSHTTAAAELKARYPVSDVLDLGVGVGYDALAKATTYDVAYWNVGLSYFIGEHVVADLRYVDNTYCNELVGPHVVDRFAPAEVGARAVLSISVGF